jgi:cytochrome P450
MYSIYLSHRQEKFWSNPGKFDPDRFSPTNKRDRLPYTYMAFGGGPRNCIGLAFARIEIKVILACIFSQFRLNLVNEKVHPHMGATLEPRPGVMMRIYHRKRLI